MRSIFDTDEKATETEANEGRSRETAPSFYVETSQSEISLMMHHESSNGWFGAVVSALLAIPAWIDGIEIGLKWMSILLSIAAAIYTIVIKHKELKHLNAKKKVR